VFLIIDEMDYLLRDELGATIFFQLVSSRHERGSTILTSYSGPIIATAILDRLLHVRPQSTSVGELPA
jgi:DNA replication protein DnaC